MNRIDKTVFETAFKNILLIPVYFLFPQHGLHDPDFGPLAAVYVRRETKYFGVLARARSVEQVLHHDQGAVVVLNHPGQKESIELFTFCFFESVHLLRREHAGHQHLMLGHLHRLIHAGHVRHGL